MLPTFHATGETDLDAWRQDPRPTPVEAWRHHLDLLDSWVHLLQRLGCDTAATVPAWDDIERSGRAEDWAATAAAIDRSKAACEAIWQAWPGWPDNGGTVPPLATSGGDWPGYGGDLHHTASSEEAGPMAGVVAWSAALGYAWYARPLIHDGRVYLASPGMRTRAWCRDLATGAEIWRTRRERSEPRQPGSHVHPQSYTSPAAASTVVHADGRLAILELGAQGRRHGQRDLLFLDPTSGRITGHSTADQADYRAGWARLAGNGHDLVYVTGTQQIDLVPPRFAPHDTLACVDAGSGEERWRFRIGSSLAEPVIDDQRVYLGTNDGLFFALDLASAPPAEPGFGTTDADRIAWQRALGPSVDNAACLIGDRLLVATSDGSAWCLDRASGVVCWQRSLCPPAPAARQLFTTASAVGERAWLGDAHGTLHALDLADGHIRWTWQAEDWLRARPVALDDQHLLVAALDGSLTLLHDHGSQATVVWRVQPGDQPLLADPVVADGRAVVVDGGLVVRCLDLADGAVAWRHHLLAEAVIDGQAVIAEELGCGGWCQSKPTAANGTVFIGSPSRFVTAFDATTGSRRWRSECSGAVSGAPALTVDGGLLVGQQGGHGEFWCLDAATGQPRWRQELGWVWSSATVDSDLAWVPCCDGHFTCLEVATGQIRWRYRSGAGAHPEAPLADGRVFFGSWDHYVYAFEAESGELLWQFHTGGTPDSGAPIAHGGRLYVPMGGRQVRCLDAIDGQEIWQYRVPSGCMNASPALADGRLYLSTSLRTGAVPTATRIRCLDAATGTEHWEVPGGGITAAVVAGNRLYTASTASCAFVAYDLAGDQPREAWRVDLGDRVFESVPALHRGRAFILAEDARVYAIA